LGDRVEAIRFIDHLRQPTLVQILARAAGRASLGDDAGGHDPSCFRDDFPSLVERALATWSRKLGPRVMELFRSWLDHPIQAVREVGRRQLARARLLDPSLIESLLAGPLLADRFSGAECAVRMGLDPLREPALRILRSALADLPGQGEYGELGGAWELRPRVVWALKGSTVQFAEALTLVAHRLEVDDEDNSLTAESEKVVKTIALLIRRWGPEGAIMVLDLMERGEVEDDPIVVNAVQGVAEQHTSVRAAVAERAARGGEVSSGILKDLNERQFERDLQGLALTLRQEIFPDGWS
jgi:hypothetical protein